MAGVSIVLFLPSESTRAIHRRVRDVPLSYRDKAAFKVTVDCLLAEGSTIPRQLLSSPRIEGAIIGDTIT